MLSIGTVVMGVADVRRAAEFWGIALGYVPSRGQIGEDFVILVSENGVGTRLALDETGSPPDEEPHVHLDLYADDAEEQRREVERLVVSAALLGPGW